MSIVSFMMFFVFLVIFSLVFSQQPQGDLLLIVEVSRHGARESVYTEYDSNQHYADSGEILPTGMRQHYILGKILRDTYINQEQLFPQLYNYTYFYVRSTQFNRTIMSAYSQLQGLYPLGSGPNITSDFNMSLTIPPYIGADQFIPSGLSSVPNNYQPVPIHTINQLDDWLLLGYNPSICGNQQKWINQNEAAGPYVDIFQEEMPTVINFAKMMNISNPNSLNLSYIAQTYDVFITDEYAGRPIPPMSNDLRTNLSYIWAIQIYIDLFQTDTQKRVLLQPFMQNFEQIISGFFQRQVNTKYYLYSAHDTTIAGILAAFNLTSWECIHAMRNQSYNGNQCINNYPEFASTVIFELRHNPNDHQNYIQIKYNGNYQRICDQGVNDYQCEVQDFIQRLQNYQIDYQQGCGKVYSPKPPILQRTLTNKTSEVPLWIYVLIGVFGGILLILIGVVFIIKKKINSKQLLQKRDTEDSVEVYKN